MDIYTIQEEAYKRGYEAGVKSVTDNNVGGKMTPTADRERLIEILRVPIYPHELADPAEVVADYLLDNGVTFAKDINAPSKWIPITERLPEKDEYTAKSKDGTEYYVRLLIAYETDIVEYEIGYYDGYKWLTEMPIHIIKDVIAWKTFEPLPEPPKGE